LEKNINHESRRHSRRDFPTNDPAREFILKASQITKRAARQPKVSNIANKYLTTACGRVCRLS
jgi:hypothetical protein